MARISSSSFCFLLLLALLFSNYNGCKAKTQINVYELRKGDFSLNFTNFGATMLSAILPDKHGIHLSFIYFSLFMNMNLQDSAISSGKLADVVLGFESIEEYKVDIIIVKLYSSL